MTPPVQGTATTPTIHESFSVFIEKTQQSCQNKLKGSCSTLEKGVCNGIIYLCEKYHNSISSIQGYDKRVVARAYQSYKRKSNYIGDATKINNRHPAKV